MKIPTTTTPATSAAITVPRIDGSDTGTAKMGVLATSVAVATNLIVFGLARAVGVEFAKTGSTPTVRAGAVLATTALAMAVGWTLVALAVRRRRPALRRVAIFGGAFAALSTLAPLTLDVDLSAKLALTSLHLIAGAFYVVAIGRLIRVRTGEAQ